MVYVFSVWEGILLGEEELCLGREIPEFTPSVSNPFLCVCVCVCGCGCVCVCVCVLCVCGGGRGGGGREPNTEY